VLNNVGDVDALPGRADSAVEHQRRALAVFQELGHRYGEASALNGLGEAVASAGQPEESLRHHRSALAITVETGDRGEQAPGVQRGRSGPAARARLGRLTAATTTSVCDQLSLGRFVIDDVGR
jgi:hypothetical protein